MVSRPRQEEMEMDAYMRPEAPLETDTGHLDAGHVCFSAIPRAATPPLVVTPATSDAVEEQSGAAEGEHPNQASTSRDLPAEQAVKGAEMLPRVQKRAEAEVRSLRKGLRAGSRAAGALEPSMAARRHSTQRRATAARDAAPRLPRILAGQSLSDGFLWVLLRMLTYQSQEEERTGWICRTPAPTQSLLRPSQKHLERRSTSMLNALSCTRSSICPQALIRTCVQVAVEAQMEGATPSAGPNITQWPP